jgi:hypothetical protein
MPGREETYAVPGNTTQLCIFKLVSCKAGSLFVNWLQCAVILRTDIIKVLWTGGGFTPGRYLAIFFAGIGLGWRPKVLFLSLFHDTVLLSLDG